MYTITGCGPTGKLKSWDHSWGKPEQSPTIAKVFKGIPYLVCMIDSVTDFVDYFIKYAIFSHMHVQQCHGSQNLVNYDPLGTK